MKTDINNDVFVKVKDTDGIDHVCPIGLTKDVNPANVEDWDDCVEGDVVGRYAGRIKIVDPVA